ncbi:MAG: hypothetical protein US48_C0006G0004 [Candidatus Levybacteria bacterium GW2011_GWA2_37_36]|nr:MAG: hypothetical protein US43_C0002G0012 [Candidatus Levybacteria bacterium GW2011_GWA1_37_16]KKQ33945.1 MAG: hypothetical protein US48_C0006G0004 [Candidatus Levybacteria bacterium GW2011_GWA2_37_36]KKQ38396.1 MAG: hypothetical protein US55_C0007G0005 [Candidatus Levybacteria bacterium GW2011_GWC2_37_7]KKQ42211.1 MAG: hypothetical protein US59_C0013G0011 [Candidatus Levybacteria bacterium GW2011_GWB1_37_8]
MKKLTTVVLLLIIVFFGSFLWWKNGLFPVNSTSKESVIFVIQKGSGLKEIASKLEIAGLIKNRVIFFLYARLGKFEEKIQAGDFRLSPSMTAQEIAQNLTHGTLDIWTTIPEGKRATEIAEILEKNMPTYQDSWKNILVQNEGYLFPDTYLIPKDADIGMIVKQMRETFDQKFLTIDTNNSKLTKSQITILASLIEREAITNAEKPIIAGILLNRLRQEIALQVDSTIQYAKGKNAINKKWWEPVTLEEYKSVVSRYNTYLVTGLPPGPISNPGLEALRAAANPTDTNYFYYLHDKNRQIRYAKTLQEHNANIEKYGL